jgi:Na+-translocating ferredoxin:NAD+ oxidoreductase RnfC subunit
MLKMSDYTSTETSLHNLRDLIDNAILDAQKCDSGNKSAGTRVRKVLLEISKEIKTIRKDILDLSKTDS